MDWGSCENIEMSEWKIYEGTDEQIEEMRNAENGFIIRSRGIESKIMHKIDRLGLLVHCDGYLICNPHPLADMIERQCRTGQPVWIRKMFYCGIEKEWQTYTTTTPDWNIPGAEYRFTPFEEEK